VCPQKVPDFDHMYTHNYYSNAIWITEKLGLHDLMKKMQDYNISLIHQFFATLVFDTNEQRSMRWMTGHVECRSDFTEFVRVLGYPFEGASVPCGVRMHSEVRDYDNKKMAPLYFNKKDCWFFKWDAHTV